MATTKTWHKKPLGILVAILTFPMIAFCLLVTLVAIFFPSPTPQVDQQETTSTSTATTTTTQATVTTTQQENNPEETLTEIRKKEIFHLISANEEKARTEAEIKYPWVPGQKGYKEENAKLWMNYKNELIEKYKNEVMETYKIDSLTYGLIIFEGIDQNW